MNDDKKYSHDEEHLIKMGEELQWGIRMARERMLADKAKRGLQVVIGNGKGMTIVISAEKAFAIFQKFQKFKY